MPIYEYRCKACSLKFEVRKRFGENSEASCPRCQGQAARVFSAVPVFFKGYGFYVTDNTASERSQLGDKSDKDKADDKEKNSEPARDERK